MQVAGILPRQDCHLVDADHLEHVRKDRADSFDPRQVGAPHQPRQDRLIDPTAVRQPMASLGAPGLAQQLMSVADALPFQLDSHVEADAPQLANVQGHRVGAV